MAAILGVIANASIVLAVYLTYRNQGVARMQYGTVILLSLLFALTGLGLGIRSCLEKDIYRLFPVLGMVWNGIALLVGGFILYLGL